MVDHIPLSPLPPKFTPQAPTQQQARTLVQDRTPQREHPTPQLNEAGSEKSEKSEISPTDWPEAPGPAAFHGLAGEIVELVKPYTEADPIAVLGTLLAFYGCAVGRGPHAMVGATRHDARFYLAIVGRSSKARKGDSMTPPRALFARADPDWVAQRLHSGLTSGEGLIAAVRDRVERTQPVKGTPGTFETVVVDEGVQDKRELIVEPELARVLQAMSRQGNTLNSVIRDAWDRGDLQNMAKGSPLRATGAHVSIIGHITVEELRRELTDTDAANGFANRFLWLAACRSQELPEPEPFEGPAVEAMARRLAELLAWGRTVDQMVRDTDARALWRDVYSTLSAERDGLAWAILARAEAQVLRLSLLYALLDRSAVVRVPHLTAALELWGYSERSVLHIFGDATGDAVADTIFSALKRRVHMTRTEISGLFGRHVSSGRISHALSLLSELNKAYMTTDDSGEGRPPEVWHLV